MLHRENYGDANIPLYGVELWRPPTVKGQEQKGVRHYRYPAYRPIRCGYILRLRVGATKKVAALRRDGHLLAGMLRFV